MPEVWGTLPKSQSDNETIEEAIARVVAEHNDDEEAHLLEGQSLSQHKGDEVIDHPAESVVADKILPRNVVLDHLADFGKMWRLVPSFETLAAWDTYNSGSANSFCNVGELILSASYNATPHYYCRGLAPSRQVKSAKPFSMRVILATGGTYNNFTSYFFVGHHDTGESENHGAGWKVVAGKLYAVHRSANGSGSTEYATEVLDLAANTEYNLYVVYEPETSIKYYVNDVLVDVHDTYLPSLTYNFSYPFSYKLIADVGGYASLRFYSPYLQQEF